MTKKHKNQFFLILAASLLLVSARAFAGSFGANLNGADVPASQGPAAENSAHITQGLISLGNAGAAANTSSANTNATANMQGNIHGTDTDHKVVDVIRHTANTHGMTPAAAQTAELEMKTNEAAQQVFAAADDLANALTLAVFQKYEGLTHEEAVALWIDEGKRYGFLPADLYVNSENNTPDSFSLISKAIASPSGDDPSYAVAFSGKGQRGEINGLQNGATYNGPAQGVGARHVQGAIWGGMEAVVVFETPGRPACSQQNEHVQCNHEVEEMVYKKVMAGEKISKVAHKITMNSIANGNGQQTGENIDHSSFFISPAYADGAQRASNVNVTGAVSNLDQAQSNYCQAATNSHDDKGAGCDSGNNKTSAWWIKQARACSLATDQTKHQADLTAASEKATDTKDVIDKHTTPCLERWDVDP